MKRSYQISLNHLAIGRCLLCLQPSLRALDLCACCETDLPWLDVRSTFKNSANEATGFQERLLLQQTQADALVTPLAYERETVWLINQQKKTAGRIASRVLADLLATAVEAAYIGRTLPNLLIPVPLHWRRELRRGINQCEVLAYWLGKRLPIKVRSDLTMRHRFTQKQSLLRHAERQTNIADAFRPTKKGHRCLSGQSIALLDDVVTTGATLGSLAKCLRVAGAGDIHLWVPVRALDPAQV